MPLNARQQRFVEEYLVDMNATQAAIRAGYTAKSAYSQGQRLTKNAEVQRAIEDGQRQRSRAAGVTADRVIREIAAPRRPLSAAVRLGVEGRLPAAWQRQGDRPWRGVRD